MKRIFIFIVLFGLCPLSVIGDTVVLENGRTIKTRGTWREGETLYFQRFGQTVGIPLSDVKEVIEAEPLEKEESSTSISKEKRNTRQVQKAGRSKRNGKEMIKSSGVSPGALKNLFPNPGNNEVLTDSDLETDAPDLDEAYRELVKAKAEFDLLKHFPDNIEDKRAEFDKNMWRVLRKARYYHYHQTDR